VSYVIPQIVGDWKSPFLNVSMRQDGTLTARLPDGSDGQGQWSVETSGRLHADVMGSRMVADASLDGDEPRSSSARTRR
jgi:hypothetical protein